MGRGDECVRGRLGEVRVRAAHSLLLVFLGSLLCVLDTGDAERTTPSVSPGRIPMQARLSPRSLSSGCN